MLIGVAHSLHKMTGLVRGHAAWANATTTFTIPDRINSICLLCIGGGGGGGRAIDLNDNLGSGGAAGGGGLVYYNNFPFTAGQKLNIDAGPRGVSFTLIAGADVTNC